MSVTVRQTRLEVAIDGLPLAGVYRTISATCSYGYDQRTATATVRVARLAAGMVLKPYLTHVIIKMYVIAPGVATLNNAARFLGVLVEVDRALYPQSIDLVCKGGLVRAERFTCDTAGGLDLSFGGLGDTDENMVRNVLQRTGLTTYDYTGTTPPKGDPYFAVLIGESDGTHPTGYANTGTGKTLGVVAPSSFVWAEGETAISFIEKLDEVSCTTNGAGGFRTYEQSAGNVVRGVVNPFADTTAAATFTEGVDLFSIAGQETIQDVQNRIAVVGYNPGTSGAVPYAASVQQANPYLTNGAGAYEYSTKQISNPMIERSLTADSGTGIAAQDVATWNLLQLNRVLYRYTFVTHRDDQLGPGQTIAVSSPTLGITSNFYLQNVTCGVDEQGALTQTLIALAGPGGQGPVALTPGADFSMSLEQESVVIGGAETTIYTVHCIPVIRGNSPVGSYSWSTGGVGSPSTGAGDTFTTIFTAAQLPTATITLSITDTAGLTASATKGVPPNAGNNYLIRKLYLAGTDCIEEWTQLAAWKSVAETGATVVANAPIWGAGASALPSGNDLGSAPTASTPFSGGETVTALWVETNVSASAVLAGGSAGHVAYSSNGGTSWGTPLAGPDSHPVLKCLISGSVPGQWFVLTQAALYRSDNSGSGWVTVVAAASGETFVDWCLSFARGMIAMSGGRLLCDLAGTAQTFPGTPPTSIQAVAADIRSDQFYCYDSAGNTYKTTSAGGTAMGAMTALPAGLGVQARGLWRDGATRGLLYIAGGSGGCWKSLDGFGSSSGYKQIRTPGTGSSPAGAVYTQIGSDGLLVVAPSVAVSGGALVPIVVISDTTWKAMSLWNGSGNNAPPVGWQNPTYDDSAWSAAIISPDETGGATYIPGTHLIWSPSPQSGRESSLFHKTFTLPAGTITSAVLQAQIDDTYTLFVNGIYVGQQLIETAHPVVQTYNVAGLLIAGGSNIIAIQATNDVDGPGGGGGVSIKLTVQ